MLQSMQITMPVAGAYSFTGLQVQRGEGSAKVIIYPHKSAWNDPNAEPDLTNPSAGSAANGDSRWAIQKGVIYIDGMLAFEFFAATLEYGTNPQTENMCYFYTPNYLAGTNAIVGFPADSYLATPAPSKYGSPLIDVAIDPAYASSPVFATENHCNWLRPGIYDLSSGRVGLNADILFDQLTAPITCPWPITAVEKYVNGYVMGRATPNSVVVIASPVDSGLEPLTTDAEGWFFSGPLHTALVGVNPFTDIPVRCRYATFVAGCTPPNTSAYASANPSTIEPALADASTITWGSAQPHVTAILIQDSAGQYGNGLGGRLRRMFRHGRLVPG